MDTRIVHSLSRRHPGDAYPGGWGPAELRLAGAVVDAA